MKSMTRLGLAAGALVLVLAASLGPSVAGQSTVLAAKCGSGGTYNGIKVPTSKQSSTVKDICKAGSLKAGVAPFAPFGFQDANGKARGASVEIVLPQMAKALGVKWEAVPTGWDTVVAGLQAKHYDVIATGLTFTAERAKLINYVTWHAEGTCYAVKKSSSITSLSQLNSPDVTIGVYTGTSWETDVPKRYPQAKIDAAVEGSGGGYRLVDVLAGRIDAAPIDSVAAIAVQKSYPSLRVLPALAQCLKKPDIAGKLGFGLRKDKAFKKFLTVVVKKNRKAMEKLVKKYSSPKYVPVGHE